MEEVCSSAAQHPPPADTLECVPLFFLRWVALLVGVGLDHCPGRLGWVQEEEDRLAAMC